MGREDIIFFDKLGYGWAVDPSVIHKMCNDPAHDEVVSERRLFEHVYDNHEFQR